MKKNNKFGKRIFCGCLSLPGLKYWWENVWWEGCILDSERIYNTACPKAFHKLINYTTQVCQPVNTLFNQILNDYIDDVYFPNNCITFQIRKRKK